MSKRVFIAGHTGMVGRALQRLLSKEKNIETLIHSKRLDYTQETTPTFILENYQPDTVVLCAAKVGGIHANNTQRADFIYENLAIQLNWIRAAHLFKLKKFILLGSSCIYPRDTKQPMPESAILTGPYEPTNQPYAIAKTAGIELCKAYYEQYGHNFYAIMPPNQYGPFDNFKEGESHAVAALLRKVYEVEDGGTLDVWGSGTPKREFMHVDDLAKAILFCLEHVDAKHCENEGFLNAGTGEECSILELTHRLVDISDKTVSIKFDSSKPDGMPRKIMDSSKLHKLGWNASITIKDGLKDTWDWLQNHWDHQDIRK